MTEDIGRTDKDISTITKFAESTHLKLVTELNVA
jgi:hypothetical protein